MLSIVADVLEPEKLFLEILARKFEESFPEAPVKDIDYQ
jgi:hypothetical protein